MILKLSLFSTLLALIWFAGCSKTGQNVQLKERSLRNLFSGLSSATEAKKEVGGITFSDTPCPVRAGSPRSYEGSGLCTGNLLLSLSVPTAGISLIHNSVAAARSLGYGLGFSLSNDKRLFLNGTNNNFVLFGDGSTLELTKDISVPTTPLWKPTLLSESISNFTQVSDVLIEERLADGTIASYEPAVVDSKELYVLTKVVDRFGNQTTYSRNSESLISEVTSPNGQRIQFNYESGLLREITGIARERYRFTYDSSLRLIEIIFPNRSRWKMNYAEGTSLISKLLSPNGTETNFTYLLGGLLKSSESNNQVTAISYTAADVTLNTTGELTKESFTAGYINAEVTNGVTATYQRDTANRVTTFLDHFARKSVYSYAGKNPFPTKVVQPTGESMDLEYNTSFLLTKTTLTDGTLVTISEFDPAQFGAMTKVTTNNKTTTFAYDRGLLNLVKSPLQATLYTAEYDSKGLKTSETDELGFKTTFGYTNLQLASIDAFGRSTTFSTDDFGNVTSANSAIFEVSHSYDEMGRSAGTSTTKFLPSGKTASSENLVTRFASGAVSSSTQTQRLENKILSNFETTYEAGSLGRISSSIWTGPQGTTVDLVGE